MIPIIRHPGKGKRMEVVKRSMVARGSRAREEGCIGGVGGIFILFYFFNIFIGV